MAEELGHPEPIQLGNFYAGEQPDPVVYEFQNYDGSTKKLSSATVVEFHIEKDGGAAYIGTGTAELVPSNELPPGETIQGFVRYAFATADMEAGHYEALFWVTAPSIKPASKKIVWYVQAGPKV